MPLIIHIVKQQILQGKIIPGFFFFSDNEYKRCIIKHTSFSLSYFQNFQNIKKKKIHNLNFVFTKANIYYSFQLVTKYKFAH